MVAREAAAGEGHGGNPGQVSHRQRSRFSFTSHRLPLRSVHGGAVSHSADADYWTPFTGRFTLLTGGQSLYIKGAPGISVISEGGEKSGVQVQMYLSFWMRWVHRQFLRPWK